MCQQRTDAVPGATISRAVRSAKTSTQENTEERGDSETKMRRELEDMAEPLLQPALWVPRKESGKIAGGMQDKVDWGAIRSSQGCEASADSTACSRHADRWELSNRKGRVENNRSQRRSRTDKEVIKSRHQYWRESQPYNQQGADVEKE